MRDEEKQTHYEVARRLLSEQNFPAAAVGGAITALLSAVAYGIVVERWPMTYGFAAAGVGVVVGFFTGFLGPGITAKFSVLAAVYTIAGCVLGSLFVRIWNEARGPASSLTDVLADNPLPVLARWSVSGLSFIHLVFWFVAVFAAAFLARRALSRSDRLALRLFETQSGP